MEAAGRLHDAVVKTKGEYELRYVPRDPSHPARSIAGESAATYPGREFGVDDNGSYLGTEEQWTSLDAAYSWIPDFYDHSIGPEPSGMDDLIETMRSVSSKLYHAPTATPSAMPSSVIDPIGSILKPTESALEEWIGVAATAFRNNFMAKVPGAAHAQAYLAAALAHAAQGNRDLYLAQRVDLLDNVTKAVTAVEQTAFCNPESVKAVLTVVGAVTGVAAGVAAIPVTGGASAFPLAAAAFTVIAGVSSGFAAQDLGRKEDTPLNANTVDGVLGKAVDGVITVANRVAEKEQQMVAALEEMYNVVTSNANVYLVPRPGVFAMSDAELRRETDYEGL